MLLLTLIILFITKPFARVILKENYFSFHTLPWAAKPYTSLYTEGYEVQLSKRITLDNVFLLVQVHLNTLKLHT